MGEEVKERRERAKKHEIKIAHGDYLALTAYCKTTKVSVTKIIDTLVKDFLNQEEVQKVVKENSQIAKKKELLLKKKEEIAKLEAELAEFELEDEAEADNE